MPSPGQASDNSGEPNAPAPATKIARKRTKTGCLTCRKRRIKCGEQKPVCLNCVKSRRVCEYSSHEVPKRGPFLDSTSYHPGNQYSAGFLFDPYLNAPDFPSQHGNFSADRTFGLPVSARAVPAAVHPAFGDPAPSAPHPFTEVESQNLEIAQRIRAQWRQKHDFNQPENATSQAEPAQRPSNFAVIPPDGSLGRLHGFPLTAFPSQFTAEAQNQNEAVWIPPSSQTFFASGSTVQSQNPQAPHAVDSSQVYNAQPQTAWGSLHASWQPLSDNDQLIEAAVSSMNDVIYQPQPVFVDETTAHGVPLRDLVDAAAVEVADDDYYDLDSEDEDAGVHRSKYGAAVDAYRPEKVASPLKHPATARVFANYIKMTVRMLSPYQRNGVLCPTEAPQSIRGPNLYTHIIPYMALHDQGVLQALLALSSLQISTLSNQNKTPSMKHYAWSLRKIRHAFSKERRQSPTYLLATLLLLQHYDVSSADLIKWISNMRITKSLLLDLDFPAMTSRFHFASVALHSSPKAGVFMQQQNMRPNESWKQGQCLDEELISSIVGFKVTYPTTARYPFGHPQGPIKEELDEYHTLQDLYWWYIKEDVTQAWVYSTPFLLNFASWPRCPPRAPIGVKGAEYGTWDHMLLLTGRASNFVSRDIPRKKLQSRSQGRPWPQLPFDGIAPSPELFMPKSPNGGSAIHEPSIEELPFATNKAMQEYQAILRACEALEGKLQAAYPPLPVSEREIVYTPWGPAVFYENCAVALLWMWYYSIRVVLARAHPLTMPPSMSIAVFVCAKTTAAWSAQVGRIGAGISSISPNDDPSQPGAMHESIGALTHCGRQMTDPAQRDTLISMLRQVEIEVGQGAAGLCVSGCEKAWEKMAENGMGPPYQRVREVKDLLADAHGIKLEANTPTPPDSHRASVEAQQSDSSRERKQKSLTPEQQQIHESLVTNNLRGLSLSPQHQASSQHPHPHYHHHHQHHYQQNQQQQQYHQTF